MVTRTHQKEYTCTHMHTHAHTCTHMHTHAHTNYIVTLLDVIRSSTHCRLQVVFLVLCLMFRHEFGYTKTQSGISVSIEGFAPSLWYYLYGLLFNKGTVFTLHIHALLPFM